MAKKVYSGEEATKGIKEGVNLIANVVKSTLGPRGRYVGLGRDYGSQHMTKDGVTVAREVEVQDPLVKFAVRTIREAASRTADVAGDGTTTATVLAQSIYNHGLKYVASGANAIRVQKGIQKAAKLATDFVKAHAVQIDSEEQLIKVATISSNHDEEMGEKVGKAVFKVGKNGIVAVEESEDLGMKVEYVDGYQIDRGPVSALFINNRDSLECILDEAFVLVTDYKFTTEHLKILAPLMEDLNSNGKSLIIVCDDMDETPLKNIVVNVKGNGFRCCVVQAPGFGERKKDLLEDLAIAVGARFINSSAGDKLDESLTIEDFGYAKKYIGGQDYSSFVDGSGDKDEVKKRSDEIQKLYDTAKTQFDKEKLAERIATLQGIVAILKVGVATEAEMKEVKDRLDDAISASKAALDGGIVAGGGVAYLNARRAFEAIKLNDHFKGDEEYGMYILLKSLREPMACILENAGLENADYIITDCDQSELGVGYDALNDKEHVHMISAGIIDPTKVVCQAIDNAVSVASQLLATKSVIVDEQVIPVQNN